MEVNEKEGSDTTFAKSSMSVLELNNYIVSLRSTVKRARQQVIQKLVRKVKMYTTKKGTEEQIMANNKKAERFLEEIKLLKKVDIDKASKYSLGNKLTIEQCAFIYTLRKPDQSSNYVDWLANNGCHIRKVFIGQGSLSSLNERVYTRVACHKSVQNKVMKWREEHDDWESLAAFAWSKITGRRFKKKKHDSDESAPGTEAEAVEVNKLKEFVSLATCSEDNDMEINDSDDQELKNNNQDKNFGDPTLEDRSPQRLPSESEAIASSLITSSSVAIGNDNQSKAKLVKSKKKAPEVIVKQITLDQLSDEELFLPPLDNNEDEESEESIADNETRADDDFFAAADEIESDGQISNTYCEVDTESEDEKSSAAGSKLSVGGRGTFSKRQNSLKERKVYSSTSYEQRKHGANKPYIEGRKTFSNKNYTKGSSRFPAVRGDSYPKKFGGPTKDKFNRKEVGSSKKNLTKSDWSNSRKFTPGAAHGDRFQKKTYKSEPSKKPLADEHLHPSWEASRRKKEQQKNLFSFQGTKKVFADDD